MIYKEIRQKYDIIFGDIIFGVKMEIIKSNAGGNKLCLNGFLYTKKSESTICAAIVKTEGKLLVRH